jgi:CheY-like chemotaxis protein
MANAHGLLTRQEWAGIGLEILLHEALGPYGNAILTRGPPHCVLRAKDGLNLALALHELATNAVKYGALSVPAGRVHIDWQVVDAGEAQRLRFIWQERGGPRVAPPDRSGFGSQLLKSVLRSAQLTFATEGVRCEIVMKLSRQGPTHSKSDMLADIDASVTSLHQPLQGYRILLVEDEPLVALALGTILEDAGADIVGPARTLRAAEELVTRDIAAAVVDINLAGHMSYPLVEALLDRDIPVIFVTGYEQKTVPARLQSVPTLQKPIDGPVLVRRLTELIGHITTTGTPSKAARDDGPL